MWYSSASASASSSASAPIFPRLLQQLRPRLLLEGLMRFVRLRISARCVDSSSAARSWINSSFSKAVPGGPFKVVFRNSGVRFRSERHSSLFICCRGRRDFLQVRQFFLSPYPYHFCDVVPESQNSICSIEVYCRLHLLEKILELNSVQDDS